MSARARHPAVWALLLGVAAVGAVPGAGNALGAGDGPGSATASADRFTLTLRGGDFPNEIAITLNGDRTRYVIRANGTLRPVESCRNPPGEPTELRCPYRAVAGFLIETEGGADTVTVGNAVSVTTILDGGRGIDDLSGGSAADELRGGPGPDRLQGMDGPDQLFGGAGNDEVRGGAGNDVVRGGPGRDVVTGGPGRNDVRP